MSAAMIQIEETYRVIDIIDPWLMVNMERMPWIVTLTGGRQISVRCPLGAAVELEEAGITIRAGVLPRR
jgi:hypothetical protein